MSIDTLKAVRDAASAGVSAVESLFNRHAASVQATSDLHVTVSADLAALKAQFGDLLTKVDGVVAELEADVAKPLADRIKALVAQL